MDMSFLDELFAVPNSQTKGDGRYFEQHFKNPLENPEYVTPELKDIVLKLVKATNNDIVFGGSLALCAVGLLKRKVKDLDIIIGQFTPIENLHLQEFISEDYDGASSDVALDSNGEEITRIVLKINEINIDIFKVAKFNYSRVNFFGETIKIQNVNEVILIKQVYAAKGFSSSLKHINDLAAVDNAISDLIK